MPEQILNPDWKQFSAPDPFNNNLVEGKICHTSNDQYGALLIEKVNYELVNQYILTTPKIRYPFTPEGNWHFPKAKEIRRYEKLDGTNVFQYVYTDAKGHEFISYKTRLLPFIGESKFGPFLTMWKEMLAKHPNIAKLPFLHHVNISYELWGARNPHLVKYETPLMASILFVRRGQNIAPPLLDFPIELVAKFKGSVDKDYVWSYQQVQQEAEENLKETEDKYYLGSEGEVWYLQTEDGKWTLFKCKPQTIEQIHWAAGGIGKNILLATIENSFEDKDEPTVEDIRRLLLEEFSEADVEKLHYSIDKYLHEAIQEHEFKLIVLAEYNTLGMSILTQKAEVMRAMSKIGHTRSDMKKLFSIIWNSEIK